MYVFGYGGIECFDIGCCRFCNFDEFVDFECVEVVVIGVGLGFRVNVV